MKSSRIFDRCLWSLLAIVLLIYILLALTASVARFYMPKLESLAPHLVEVLAEQTGLDWQVHGISGELRRFRPVFNIQSLSASLPVNNKATAKLQNATERDIVLALTDGQLQIDLVASLLDREPRLISLQAKRLSVSLEKTEAELWKLRGVRLKRSDRQISLEGVIAHLQQIAADEIYIDLPSLNKVADKNLQDPDNRSDGRIELPKMQMHFQRFGDVRRFVFQQHEEDGGSVKLFANSIGNIFSSQAQLEIYLQAEAFSLSPWFASLVEEGQSNYWMVDDWTGELWLSRSPQQRWRGSLNVDSGSIQRSDSPQWRMSDMSLRLGIEVNEQDGIDFWWQQLGANWRDEPLNMPVASVSIVREHKQVSNISIRAPLVDVGQLTEIIAGSELLAGQLPEVLTTLHPQGTVKQLHVAIPNGRATSDFALQALLEGVSFEPWRNIPGATGVDAYIEATAAKGSLLLASEQDFSIYFPRVYRQALEFGSAHAQIDWAIEHQRIVIDGRDIALDDRATSATYGGDFAINARLKPDGEYSQMTLNVGVKNAAIKNLLPFLPYTSEKSLQDWVAQSDAQGEVIDGAFMYHGSLRKEESDRRSILLYFNVADASLNFHQDWPKVTQLDGLVGITGSRSDVSIYSADFASLAMSSASVSVFTGKQKQSVEVEASLSGGLSAALAVLQGPALKQQLGEVLGDWRAKGKLRDSRIKIKVPLSNTSANNTWIDFSGKIQDASLAMRNIDLTLNKLNGPIAYSSERGLVSKQLKGVLWDKPIELRIGDYQNNPDQQNGANVKISGQSKVDMKQLYRWLNQPLLAIPEGVADFNFSVDHIDSRTSVSASSDMRGVALALPAPLYKAAQEPARLKLRWQMSAADQPMRISLENRADIKLNFTSFKLTGGHVAIGDDSDVSTDFKSLANNGLAITGHLKQFNLSEWLHVFDRYQAAEEALAKTNNQQAEASETSLLLKDLRLDELLVFDESFSNSVVDAAFVDRRWLFSIESDQLQGDIALPVLTDKAAKTVDQKSLAAISNKDRGLSALPLVTNEFHEDDRYLINLDYLRLDKIDVLDKDASNLTNTMFAPASLFAARVDIQQLYLADQVLGRWHFLISPNDTAVLVHDIDADYAGLSLRSGSDEGLLWALSESGEMASAVSVKAQSNSIETFISQFDSSENPSSPIKGKQTDILIDLNWQGGPDAFSLNNIEGDIGFRVKDGQFLRASGSAQGLLKLVGIINLDTLVRRMQLNFSDLYKEGLSFDRLNGTFNMQNGIVGFRQTPITVSSPSSTFSMSGQVNLDASTIDAELIATLPVASNLPWIAALAGGLPVAAGVFIASKVFENELDRLSSAVYIIEGPLADPDTRFDRLFDNKGTSKNNNELTIQEPSAETVAKEINADFMDEQRP